MVNNDSNIIKAVENLQNIAGLTPIRDRENKKRQQRLRQEGKQNSEQEQNKISDQKQPRSDVTKDKDDQNTIDYCA